MENRTLFVRLMSKASLFISMMLVTIIALAPSEIASQCVAPPGTINGLVYTDLDNNGIKANTEVGLSGIAIHAYNNLGQIVGNTITSGDGTWSINGLTNGSPVKVVFTYPTKYSPSFAGTDNGSNVQFVNVPSCGLKLGLVSYSDVCNGETMIVTPCFVQGNTSENTDRPTLVGIKYGFDVNSQPVKIAQHSETGSVWGVAYKSSTSEIFSSAFVKQLVGLKNGHDAIFKTVKNGNTYSTTNFVKLSNLGQSVGTLSITDVKDCNYGTQVGKFGIGGLAISPDEKYLYAINLFNNTLVKIPTVLPTAANTVAYNVPNPNCSGGSSRAFALKVHKNKIYVGVTCTADISKSDDDSAAHVYEFDPNDNKWTLIFSTTYLKGYWYDSPSNDTLKMQWITDIDFSDDGNMILGFSDRLGHRFCNTDESRLDEQKSDILMVWNNNGVWTLENNGSAGSLTGSGVGNTQGPGNGEFFGEDYFPFNPKYHPEITLGGLYALPGTNSVVAVVFDPDQNTYSGGLHRYSTRDGKLLGKKELYSRNVTVNLGKATGFGDVIAICTEPEIEVGNYAWFDLNDNGIQDAGENPISGLNLYLYDRNCNLLTSTTTNSKGQYFFNKYNVNDKILADASYFVGLDNSLKDAQTGNYLINGTYYKPAQNITGQNNLNSDATNSVSGCDKAAMAVKIPSSSHNYDLGLRPTGPCSVKITSSLANEFAQLNEPLNITLKMQNRGGTLLTGFELSNPIPLGMLFNASENVGWVSNNGILTYVHSGNLTPDQTVNVNLRLRFNQSAPSFGFTNTATISKIRDYQNVWTDDLEGCLVNDEDALTSVTPIVCDLALIHNVQKNQIITKNGNVTLVSTVCNQGNLESSDFTIVNYRNEELDFDPSLNRDWKISQDLQFITFENRQILKPNECRDFEITYTLKDKEELEEIVNYAEIRSGTCTGSAQNRDFDSTPDNQKTNDNGGQPKTASDNEMNDHGQTDEDDHDPAVISLRVFDLSLRKTVKNRRVKPNELVTFDIAITNEGDIPASAIKITDYIPEYLTLSDENWVAVGNNAERMITIPGNLQPGNTIHTYITFTVAPNVPVPFTINNFAEITEVYDALRRDISKSDIDSNPDNIKDLSSEDDISRANVVLLGIDSFTPCSQCRQGSTPDNGQFVTSIVIAGPSGDDWRVESSLNLYDASSPAPPGAPTILPDGFMLTETPILSQPGHSLYTLQAVYLDGQEFAVRFINKYGDLEQVESAGSACNSNQFRITGPQSVCSSAELEYFLESEAETEDFNWYLDGVLISNSDESVVIDWGGYPIGNHTISVVSLDNPCIAPFNYNVSTGVADVTSISCISNLNISMDGDCEIEITPGMLVAGTINLGSPYIVTIMDQHGNVIPSSPFVTKEYVGKKLKAKLLDGCGGNSCWSNILVEDKLAPIAICRDIDLPCDKLEEYEGPFESDNCGSPIKTTIINEVITPLTCNEDFVKYIDRQYQATDASGNKSAICEMRIRLKRPDMSQLTFPHNRTIMNDSVLICGDDTSPEALGVPMLAGKPIYPTSNPICNVFVGYSDEMFDLGCSKKIVREWLVIEEWCSRNDLMYSRKQIIEIIDTLDPKIEPLPNQVVTTNGGTICEGDVILALPEVSDSCSSTVEVDVIYPGGFIDNMTAPRRITLPADEHTIQYIAYDKCYNSSSMSIVVVVEDNTAPTMVCKGTNAVGLNNNGEAIIYPHHLDNGSFDGCGIETKEIALMGINPNLPPITPFGPSLLFDCDYGNSTVMIALMVTDVNGNTNSCMVNIEIQDKIAPTITCPPNLTVECGEIDNDSDLSIYGNAVAYDVCGAEVTEDTPDRNLTICGTGEVIRYFTADDGESVARCAQIITIEKSHIWDPDTDLDESIDFEINNMCRMTQIHPDSLDGLRGRPVIRQDLCDMVSSDYEDHIYNIVQGACMKVLRRWTVVDWCEMERLGDSYVPYEFTQVIKIINTIDPEFLDDEIAEIDTVYAEQGNCNNAPYRASASASHQCSITGLEWSFNIDYGNDGTIDEEDYDAGDEFEIDTELPLGVHRIIYSFEDGCGNVTTRSKLVVAVNRDLPSVVPINPVIVSIQPWDLNGDGTPDIEKACIDAATLDASSTASCCDGIPLTFSFSEDPDSTTTCFDCFDVGPNNYIQLWAHDCQGNSSFTLVQVIVQDNNNSNICELICQNNRPIVTINTPAPICPNSPVVLTATVTNANTPAGANATYEWSTGATTQSITVNPSSPIEYSVTVSNQVGCSTVATRTVTVRQSPNIAISGNQNICQGQSTTLTASGGTAYIWSTGATTSSITVTPQSTITYVVTGTDSNGCTATASRQVNVGPLPSVTINPAVAPTICLGQSTSLTAVVTSPSGTPTFAWSNGLGSNATVTVSPTNTITYTVTATVNGCTNTATKMVTVNTASASITGNNTICVGGSTTFTASGGGSYLWSNGASTSTINITNLTQSATFTVTVTATNGCTATASRNLTVNPLPVPSLSTVPTSGNVCVNGVAMIIASGGTTYAWSNGATTSSITTPPLTSAATFTVTVTNSNGCSASSTRTIGVLPQPSVSISSNSPVCLGNPVNLTATASGGTAPYTFGWGNGSSANPLTINPTSSGTIAVTVTDANGCTRATSSAYTVNPLPVAAIAGEDVICLGESTTLTASGGPSYLWSANANNATTASVTVMPTNTTIYRVTVTNSNNCTATASKTVSVDPGVLMCQTQNITAYLGSTGSVTITPQMISVGNMGACDNFTATVSPNMFFCNDAAAPNPTYTVTLTVTNTNTNQSLSCTAQVTIADTIKPVITCPANITVACNLFNPNNLGSATATDNCPNGLVINPPVVINTLNQCNVGSITRTFTARDLSNNQRSCTQIVTVNNPTPLTLSNITFPGNITVTNCQGIDPTVTNSPVINTNGVTCSDISVSFTDDHPAANPLCADIILRTWSVIDSCQLSATNPNAGRFTSIQTIIVTVQAPVITGPNVINLFVNPVTCTATLNQNPPLHSATGCNLVLSNSINNLPTFNINGNYPVGTTNVTLTARETCNNQTATKQVQIIVVDTTETEFTCRKTFPRIRDTNPPMAIDTARNHVLNLEVSCTNQGTVRVSFSRTNVADSITVYGCEDLLVDHTIKVYLWVNTTVVDSCITIATPIDPGDFCTNNLVRIAGNIKTENDQNVPNVLMGLEGANISYPTTDINGKYIFPLMERGGEYTLTPSRSDNYMDGVSTLDLVMIQRHILKLNPLNSPYKLIAADVNKDDKITSADMVELRKLILGLYAELPNNESWRLIDANYVFPDPTNPFMAPFTEKYYIPSLNSNMLLDWTGVKIGDVNNSYITNVQNEEIESRSVDFGLQFAKNNISKGHNTIDVTASKTDQIYGYQLALLTHGIRNVRIKGGIHQMDDANFVVNNEDQILLSWHDVNRSAVKEGQVLFTLEFDSDIEGLTDEIFTLGDKINAEYYDEDLGTHRLRIGVDQPKYQEFTLLGNTPNPWIHTTDIRFAIPSDGKVDVKIKDITGRVVYQTSNVLSKGQNVLSIHSDQINAKGILIYEVTHGDKSLIGKMINIK
jgi:uncharacterized repeat protein (TIGR01451 family)